jgi:hypothetical protein
MRVDHEARRVTVAADNDKVVHVVEFLRSLAKQSPTYFRSATAASMTRNQFKQGPAWNLTGQTQLLKSDLARA